MDTLCTTLKEDQCNHLQSCLTNANIVSYKIDSGIPFFEPPSAKEVMFALFLCVSNITQKITNGLG